MGKVVQSIKGVGYKKDSTNVSHYNNLGNYSVRCK